MTIRLQMSTCSYSFILLPGITRSTPNQPLSSSSSSSSSSFCPRHSQSSSLPQSQCRHYHRHYRRCRYQYPFLPSPTHLSSSQQITNISNNEEEEEQEKQERQRKDNNTYVKTNRKKTQLPDMGPPAEQISLDYLPLQPYSNLSNQYTDLQKVGAYAIRDAKRILKYIGYSKNIGKKLKFHKHTIAGIQGQCQFYQVFIPNEQDVDLITAEELENILHTWVMENNHVIPKGNDVDQQLWEVLHDDSYNNSGDNDDDDDDDDDDDNELYDENQAYSQRQRFDDENHVQYEDYNYSNYERGRRGFSRRYSDQEDVSDFYAEQAARGAYNKRRGRRRDWGKRRDGEDYFENRTGYYDGWESIEDDDDDEYVDVDVDPFDPFSASRYGKRSNRYRERGSVPPWVDDNFGMKDKQDWVPIILVMGLGTVLWLFGLFSHSGMPFASP